MTVLVVRDDRFLDHNPGPGHPERPDRLRCVHEWIDAHPLEGIHLTLARAATPDQLIRVHSERHFAQVKSTAGQESVALDPDTRTSPGSYLAATLAAGAAVQCVEQVVSGASQGGFALVRPPGHHAESDTAMGFCLFNNVAIAAAHATEALGVERVLVVDPDVHHGNGTQSSFWKRDDVLYVSSHRYPFYPGTGAKDEIGAGAGEGFTVNLPMPPGFGDAELLHLYEAVVTPIVEQWKPQLILVSAGFDTWLRDPLGGMRVTEAGYLALFGLFRRWSDAHCPGRLVACLEGGYDLDGMVAGVRAGLTAMTAPAAGRADAAAPVNELAVHIAEKARAILHPFWHFG